MNEPNCCRSLLNVVCDEIFVTQYIYNIQRVIQDPPTTNIQGWAVCGISERLISL